MHALKPRARHLEQAVQLLRSLNMIWIPPGSLVRLWSSSYKIGEQLVQCWEMAVDHQESLGKETKFFLLFVKKNIFTQSQVTIFSLKPSMQKATFFPLAAKSAEITLSLASSHGNKKTNKLFEML